MGLQFKKAISILASFLEIGYSLENGLAMSVAKLEGLYGKEGMITQEFTVLSAGVRTNRQPEQPLMEFGSRSGLGDMNSFTQVFAAARRNGRELVGIIHYTAGIIRDKVQVQGETHTMTASRVSEQKIASGISFLVTLYINFTLPGFLQVMYETIVGRCIVMACLAACAGALVLTKEILEIEVQRIEVQQMR